MISFPFSANHGWAQAEGLLHFDGTAVTLEFVLTTYVFRKSRVKEVRIPLADIAAVSFRKGWGSAVLVIRGARMTVFGDLPSSNRGQVELTVGKEDRAAAEYLASRLQRDPHSHRPDSKLQPEAPDLDLIRVDVKGHAGGLLLTGIAAGLSWAAVLTLVRATHAWNAFGQTQWVERPLGDAYPGLIPLTVIPSLLICFGALWMRFLRGYEFSVMAVILAMLPWYPAWPAGVFVAMWALYALRRPDVKAAFAQTHNPAGRALEKIPPATPVADGPRPRGVIRRKMGSFLHGLRYYCIDTFMSRGPSELPPTTAPKED